MAKLDNHGDVEFVQGSGAKPYELKNVDGVLSCSCPAWRNFGGPVDKRTCKHLKQVRGEASEAARIGSSSPVKQVLASTARTSSAAPNVSVSPRAAGTAAAERLAAGEKLRPDEKAKLYGPPVLLAESLDSQEDQVDVRDWWMSEKLDGVRAYWNGSEFITRQGNVYRAPDWFTADLPKHPLDGELWMGRKMFQQTISIVKSANAGERWRKLTYVVFDAPAHGGKFEDRMTYLLELQANLNPKHMRVLKQERVNHMNHLLQTMKDLVAEGAEGMMVRQPGSLYVAGRSSTLLKVKPFQDAEAVIVAHYAGKGRHKGRLGGLEVRMPDGKTFRVGTGLSDEQRRNPPPVGKTITYRFTEHTDGGIPKCASFVAVRDYE